MPNGGIRMVKQACEAYFKLDPKVEDLHRIQKTHNQGVFDAYTPETAGPEGRHHNRLAGCFGRGRIIGDYRRVPLYGVDRLIEDKKRQLEELETA